MQAINTTDAAARRKQEPGTRFLDIREAQELAICKIEGAHHIAMSEIATRFQEIPRDKPLIVFCHHGMRSRQVILFLAEKGYTNLINLDGGIHAWAIEIDPSLSTY